MSPLQSPNTGGSSSTKTQTLLALLISWSHLKSVSIYGRAKSNHPPAPMTALDFQTPLDLFFLFFHANHLYRIVVLVIKGRHSISGVGLHGTVWHFPSQRWLISSHPANATKPYGQDLAFRRSQQPCFSYSLFTSLGMQYTKRGNFRGNYIALISIRPWFESNQTWLDLKWQR